MAIINNEFSKIINNYLNTSGKSSATSASETESTTKFTNTALKRYLDSTPKEDLNATKIFDKLSIDVGGDTKTITKDELDSYVKNAKEGKVKISDNEMNALTTLQKEWDKISLDGEKITSNDVIALGHKDTLLSMAPDETDNMKDLRKLTADSTAEAYSYVLNSALNFSPDKNPTSGAKSLLNTLLTGRTDENDDSNANLIDKLVNIIESYKSISTIEEDA